MIPEVAVKPCSYCNTPNKVVLVSASGQRYTVFEVWCNDECFTKDEPHSHLQSSFPFVDRQAVGGIKPVTVGQGPCLGCTCVTGSHAKWCYLS